MNSVATTILQDLPYQIEIVIVITASLIIDRTKKLGNSTPRMLCNEVFVTFSLFGRILTYLSASKEAPPSRLLLLPYLSESWAYS